MNKILFLSSKYLPNPSTNGLVLSNLVNEYKTKYEVHILCNSRKNESEYEVIDDIHIHRVSPSIMTQVSESAINSGLKAILIFIIRVFRTILGLLVINHKLTPDLIQINKLNTKINNLYILYEYKKIISISKPIVNIEALLKFSKSHKNVECYSYFFDLPQSSIKGKISSYLFRRNVYKFFKNCANTFTKTYITEWGRSFLLKDSSFNKWSQNIYFIGIPVYIPKVINTKNQEEWIKVVYAGSLEKRFRNPQKVFEIMRLVSIMGLKIDLLFITNYYLNEYIVKYSSGNLRVRQMGLIRREKLYEIYAQNDYIINICNKINDAVPSKIFEIFSLKKPIINFKQSLNDISDVYFDKYNHHHNVIMNNDFRIEAKFLHDYFTEYMTKKVIIDTDEIFKTFQPRYIYNMLEGGSYE